VNKKIEFLYFVFFFFISQGGGGKNAQFDLVLQILKLEHFTAFPLIAKETNQLDIVLTGATNILSAKLKGRITARVKKK